MRRLLVPLQLLLPIAVLVLSAVLWLAGRSTVLEPNVVRGLLGATVLCALLTLLGAFLLRARPPLALATAAIGLIGLAATAAFPYLLVAGLGEPLRSWHGPASPTVFERLRVVQYNVLHGYPAPGRSAERRARLAEALARQQADVLVLNEVWDTVEDGNLAEALASELGMHAVYARANGSRRLLGFEEGTAILSRYPLLGGERLVLAPDATAFERRIALLAELEHPLHGAVGVVGLHLHHRDPQVAEAQALDLLRQLRSRDAGRRPVVVAGDFNLPSGVTALERYRQAGFAEAVDGGIDHLWVAADAGWRVLWGEVHWPAALDESPGASGSSAGPALGDRPWSASVPTMLSDHPLLVAELEPVAPPRASRWPGSWQHVAAQSVGMDPVRLRRTVEEIGAMDGIECVLVLRDGRLVAEEYFRGASPDQLRNVKSVSKSILSALLGIALERGYLALDDPIADYLPQAASLDDPRKRAITVENLATMRTGLESTSFGNYGAWVSSRDWVAAALARPLVDEPGTRRRYSTGDTHLLSAVLTAASGTSTLELARRHLLEPLGIERVRWQRDPTGIYVGGNNLSMTARDLARFGLLYLDRGLWGDRQVVPWHWVDRSTRPSGPLRPDEWGSYGHLWWMRPPEERGAYTANGFGGQHLWVSRADELVVVIGATQTSKGWPWRQRLFGLVRDGIVGSVVSRSGAPVPADPEGR